MAYRIGADIGGTFTDIALIGPDGIAIGKVLTTPERPDDAVIAGIAETLEREGVAPGAVEGVVHGTTLFTNALIERKGAKTALVTTKGFRDAIEIGREHRYDMYDLAMERPRPLAPRHRRFELEERVLADGTVTRPFDEAEARALAGRVVASGAEAVAISFLHAYAHPAHEEAMERILAEEAPELTLSRSSDVAPEIREYDRTSTVLANVYVKAIAERYLGRLAERLQGELGIRAPLRVMLSNGGLAEVATAVRFPVRLVESGPAAGALAARHMGCALSRPDLLSFDMGGTTAKASIIQNGEPLIAREFEVDRRYRFKKGSGLPVKVPVIEMIEIGTGGGSLASVDGLGRLRVGPESAGASPGPAAYALGGERATVTDADLTLGYLDPGHFLGGAMRLDPAAARVALARDVARPLNLSEDEAAVAVHRLANEAMAAAARLHGIERGVDVEKLPLFAFGGAGPVHAWGVARILRSPAVIYPRAAGVMSAVGFLTAPLAFDFVRTLPGEVENLDWDRAAEAVAGMEAEGRAMLSPPLDPAAVRTRRYAEMRYRRQGYELRVAVPEGEIGPAMAAPLAEAFERDYAALYGHGVPGAPVEVVAWRVVAEGPAPDLSIPPSVPAGEPLKGHRAVWLPEQNARREVPVYDRYALAPAATLAGPCIVEERESTVVVTTPARIEIDAAGNLIAEPE